ncbi:alkaline phosphatase, partial [Salmonella enterica]|nr:alkaline phosphatase [Salmonella enterica]
MRQYNIDIAFISTSSWDFEHGISTPDEGKMLVKQAVLASSRRNVLVSDSSKYGKYGMFHICQLDQIDDIICDE